ncbi:hypothetical protein QL285_071259 [Trifolium repens]|jgi:hypothetical protein|nr:hypothetical protein QL285_071259 [Trifolium repens]
MESTNQFFSGTTESISAVIFVPFGFLLGPVATFDNVSLVIVVVVVCVASRYGIVQNWFQRINGTTVVTFPTRVEMGDMGGDAPADDSSPAGDAPFLHVVLIKIKWIVYCSKGC